MTCYHPYTVVFPAVENADGKRVIDFRQDPYHVDESPIVYGDKLNGIIEGFKIKIPCGRCIGCRLDYSRSWAVRTMQEASMYGHGSFVTLTFDDEHLPDDRSLNKGYFSSWMKRFRKKFGEGIRFVAAGEYGEKFKRPHYHVLFLNFDFPDKKYWSQRHGQIYYRSELLEEVWRDASADVGNGYSVIGDVSFESAAYVSRYVTKKFKSKDDDEITKHYGDREAEFLLTSRMPGIGHDFIIKNYEHIFNNGFCVMKNGHKAPIPRYYFKVVQDNFPEFYQKFILDRYSKMYDNLFKEDINSTQQRLQVREELQKLKLDKLVRTYEFDELLHNI